MPYLLKPLQGGMYDPDLPLSSGSTVFGDLPYLLDADSHSHVTPCGIWCPRKDVVVAFIPDDGGTLE